MPGEVDSTLGLIDVADILKDSHSFPYHRLWYLDGLVICSDLQDEVGHLLFRSIIHGGTGCHFFLEVSKEPLKMIPPSHFLCLIYMQGTSRVSLVKNMVMKQPQQMYIDHIFVRAIKYAAGAKYEENVDVKFSAVKSSHSRFWRNLNAGDTAFFEKICVFVVYPNKMK